ncbi:MAG: ATP-binding cassette domain-containing protein [Planctomycetaceae bacterium]|nr:ATP-binding cassette domain-containing protein [Planctomycetaceae bacterium]
MSSKKIKTPQNVPEIKREWLSFFGAKEHNLKNIDVSFPIGALSVVTGVSGSGKSSLVNAVIRKTLAKIFQKNSNDTHDKIDSVTVKGAEHLNKMICVDQQPIGQTPTSNPATYTGVFDFIRELFAMLPESRVRGYSARRFSFNVPDGRCEKCEGAGQIKIEMHFLPDVWITCDACNGKRYDRQTLDIKYQDYSIADILEMSCGDALKLFANIPRIHRILQLLCDVGLDYISLGQAAPTLSGGESQRIKLASELARPDTGRTLYLLDEPTTGLHFEDMHKLLYVIHRLVDLGNTVIVIEHNLDIIKNADWVVDLGPEAGDAGGYLLFEGLPEELVSCGVESYTAKFLAPVLKNGIYETRTPYSKETQEQVESISLDDIGIDTSLPWEKDGIKWHTQDRISTNGNPAKWDGQILLDIVKRIEATEKFADTNWNNRSVVEIYTERKNLGWFMRAITSDEWLLKIKFRTAGGTFNRIQLTKDLNIKPLNETDDIPLHGAEPRVKVTRQTIHWQEIELKIHSYHEIDRPEFWTFIDIAIDEFAKFAKPSIKNPEDLMPWKVLGEKWHFLPKGFIDNNKPAWETTLLTEIIEIIKSIDPKLKIIWTNKLLVTIYKNGQQNQQTDTSDESKQIPWIKIHTKRTDAIYVELYVDKNAVLLDEVKPLGFDPFIAADNKNYDIVQLKFRKKNELKKRELKNLIKKTL